MHVFRNASGMGRTRYEIATSLGSPFSFSNGLRLITCVDLLGISILKTQSRWKTPWVAILVNSVLIAVGTLMPFEFLVQMDQLFYSLGLILEYLSLVKLRFSQPDLHRPYKIPLNKWLLIVFITLPLIFCGFTTITPLISNWKIAVITAGCLIFGGISYPAMLAIRKCLGTSPPQVAAGIN
jgi:amino acid transporter